MNIKKANRLILSLGRHETAYQKALAEAEAAKVIARMWDGDHTLWADSDEEIGNRLGWLDIANRMVEEIDDLRRFADEIKDAGIEKILLLGMGGSSLAPEVFSKIIGSKAGFPSLSILDSTDAEAVQHKLNAHEPSKSLFIVSTKSGGTVETLSFFKSFYNHNLEQLGKGDAGKHFVAITDPGSKLETLAKEFSFRRIFLNDPNMGGRYSALSHFGLVPAALMGIDLSKLLERTSQISAELRADGNEGLQFGIALGVLANASVDKLTIVTDKDFASFSDWAEQLIAESTGKGGKGILPVVREEISKVENYSKDRLFIEIAVGDRRPHAKKLKMLEKAGFPILQIKLEDHYDLGAQFLFWEFATAIAGYEMKLHPFNQPNVEAAKVLARSMVEAYFAKGELPESSLEDASAETIQGLVGKSKEGAYIAIHSYSKAGEEVTRALSKLRMQLFRKFGLASTLGFGPRFLHSAGQLHKGDGGKGLFIQLISEAPEVDLAIPLEAGSKDSEISYGVLKRAQAIGDAKALVEAGREVVTIPIEGDFTKGINKLVEELQ